MKEKERGRREEERRWGPRVRAGVCDNECVKESVGGDDGQESRQTGTQAEQTSKKERRTMETEIKEKTQRSTEQNRTENRKGKERKNKKERVSKKRKLGGPNRTSIFFYCEVSRLSYHGSTTA